MTGPPGLPPRRSLPRLLVLTDRHACVRPLVDVVRAAVDGGARAVVLREKDLPGEDRARLADELRAVLDDSAVADTGSEGVLLVLAGTAMRGEAMHLAAADVVPVPRPALLGRSCHDARELAAANDCDWVTVSPVWETSSKPGYGPALHPDGLAALLPGAPPAYALGGVDSPARARQARAAGAHGVAVLGAVMRAARPDRAVAALLEALRGGP